MENLSEIMSSEGFEFKTADLAQPEQFEAVVGKVLPEVIVHLAGLVSVQESIRNPPLNQLLNVTMTKLLEETSARHRIPRVVYASSAAVYGMSAELLLSESSRTAPTSPYGLAKLESEAILIPWNKRSGPEAICLRYFNIYGPRQNANSPYSGVIAKFSNAYATASPITVYGDGNQRRDFIHVFDVAQATAVAATSATAEPGIYTVCTGKPTSVLEVIEFFNRLYRVTPAVRFLPPAQGDIRHSCGDASKARDKLGFFAEVGMADGLQSLKL